MFLQRQSVVLHFGTLVIQLVLTRTLSCKVIVVALLVSYLLFFNGVLAGCGDTVMFLQSTDNCMPTSVHQVTYFSVLYRIFHYYRYFKYQYHSMPHIIEVISFYSVHFLPCNNRIALYVMPRHLLLLIIFNCM